jgi:precorrin-2 dehydrogenase/sirohydrochlorin ferrochelatase
MSQAGSASSSAPVPWRPVRRALEKRGLAIRPRKFRAGDLGRYALVFGATDDAAVNRELSRRSRRLGIPVNVSDDPEKSTFIVPAVYRRGDLTIAISTSGRSPAAARAIREDLEAGIGREYASLVDLLGSFREKMAQSVRGHRNRMSVWRKIMAADVLGTLRRGGRRAAEGVVRRHIREAEKGGRR